MSTKSCVLCAVLLAAAGATGAEPERLRRLPYNNPGLVVDLGVGLWAWPLPMDYDGDGDLDLLVSCPDKPSNGTYFFENRGDGDPKFPVFEPGVRVGPGHTNVQVSYVDGRPRVLVPGSEVTNLHTRAEPAVEAFTEFRRIYESPDVHRFAKVRRVRANQWR